MRTSTHTFVLIALFAFFVASDRAAAHGIVGDRFFPATVSTDDPLAADELALPTVQVFTPAGSPGTQTFDVMFEFDKLILPHLSVGIADDVLTVKPDGRHSSTGWDDVTLIAKYELMRDDVHEAILTVGTRTVIGGTGNNYTGADSFTTFVPELYYGKGFGDLPDSLDGLKPLAVTGTFSNTFPTESVSPNVFQWAFAVEYSLPYLQQHVADVGLPEPFKNFIPLVEVAMETVENRDRHGQTTGTINPGVLWETKDFQLGVEALVPVNGHTGPHVGAIVQVQVYVDDIFPAVFGHPLFFGDER